MTLRILFCVLMLFSLILTQCSKKISPSEYYYSIMTRGTSTTKTKANYPKENKVVLFNLYLNKYYVITILYDSLFPSRAMQISGTYLDKPYGHYFKFNNNGSLSKYFYYSGDEYKYTYSRTYTLDGILDAEEGTPLVAQIDTEDSNTIFFSSVFYDQMLVKYGVKKSSLRVLKLRKSDMMPFLFEGVIEKHNETIYLELISHNSQTNESNYYLDSLQYH